ncbi:MAG: UvrD-helicase domain-containing protein [Planctomycetota bacterium]|nr:UvrD-helicase domain-containing protein [Planctomycetota bacterium]
MPAFTNEQATAINTRDVSVALSAGAGCGKTFVLTQRFLAQIALGENAADLSSVVAITFTDRAAREMRERVRRMCRERLAQCPPEEADHWQKLVREVDSARISTIHSFCMTLLRSHAVEAGIDPQSRLFDETTGGAFLRRSLVKSLHDLLVARDPDAMELVQAFNWEGVLGRLEILTPQRYRIDPTQWMAKSPEELADHWIAVWNGEAVPKLLQRLVESRVAQNVVRLLAAHETDHPVMAERRQTLLAELPALPDSRDPLGAIERLVAAAGIRGGGTKKNWVCEEVYNDIRDGFSDLRKALNDLLEKLDFDRDLAIESARISLAALRVADRAGREYDQRKRDEGWLDFDDLLISASELLRKFPEVCRRAANSMSLLMVDEFQDTDRLQAEIVKRLCGDELTRGKLFLVGDVKQSIYRFRRAEPRVFRELRELLPIPGRLPLTGNFRSQPAVLQFVNALCDGALGGEYEALSPQTPQVTTDPCIEFLFAMESAEPIPSASAPASTTEGEEGESIAEAGKETVADQRRREAAWIARRLRQLLDDKVPRVREKDPATGNYHLRPVDPRDIVILFRAMTDVRYYEEALRELEVDHYVVGGRAFYSQQEIYDIVNLCLVLDEPDDEVALIGLLRSPFFALTDDDLLLARIEKVTADPNSANPAAQALATLDELRQLAPRTTVAELLQAAIDRTGYDASLLTEFLGDRKLANLRKLIDLARDFDRTGMFTLADFARHLSSAVAEESRESLAATHPESSNVVRLMTIHQSKGLEFPVVVLADMNRVTGHGQGGPQFDEKLGPLVSVPRKFSRETTHLGRQAYAVLEADEDLAEIQRLLYVATTRAADLLILSASLRERDAGFEIKHPWMQLLQERFDLRTGQPRMEPGTGGVSALAKYSGQIPAIHIHQARPEITATSTGTESRRLPLTKLRDAVERAIPAGLPDSMRVFAAGAVSRERFSVSELEELVAERLEKASRNDLNELHTLVEVKLVETAGDAEAHSLPPDDATTLGTLVHRALELLQEDPAEALDRVVRASPIEVSEAIRAAAARCIERLRHSDLFEELRRLPGTHREIDFLLPWPTASGDQQPDSRMIAGQIDALIPGEGGWSVVDYKTAKPSARGELARSALAKYGIQLGVYCLAVTRLTGRLPVRLELVYLPSATRLWIVPTQKFLDRIVSLVQETTSPE